MKKIEKEKPIKNELEFEDILESLLKVKPPEKKKPVENNLKEKGKVKIKR